MTQDIKIVTWNVWFDTKFQAERIRAIVEEIQSQQPDVACLQEITPPILQLILGLIDKQSYRVWFDEYSANPYGQIFIVKLGANVTAFGSHPFPDTQMNRRIYYLTFSNRTTILNVHLESEFSGNPNSNKAKQLSYLLQFARRYFGSHIIFIAGDFNLAPQDDAWSNNTIRTLGFADISPLNLNFTYDYTANTNISLQYRSYLDRILCNVPVQRSFQLLGKNPIKVKRGKIYPSDHFGISMYIVLAK